MMLDDNEMAAILNGVRGRIGPNFASFAQSGASVPIIEEVVRADREKQIQIVEEWWEHLAGKLETHEQAYVLVCDAVFELIQELRGKKL